MGVTFASLSLLLQQVLTPGGRRAPIMLHFFSLLKKPPFRAPAPPPCTPPNPPPFRPCNWEDKLYSIKWFAIFKPRAIRQTVCRSRREKKKKKKKKNLDPERANKLLLPLVQRRGGFHDMWGGGGCFCESVCVCVMSEETRQICLMLEGKQDVLPLVGQVLFLFFFVSSSIISLLDTELEKDSWLIWCLNRCEM